MLSETQTRRQQIDLQLGRAGWSVERGNLAQEFHLPPPSQVAEARAAYEAGDQYADYLLRGRDGKPIGLVEAKRSSRDPLVGERQASEYADRLQALHGVEPFIFLTNGRQIWFLERGRYPVRQISGFYTPDDLERLAFQRRYGRDLSAVEINPKIIDRPYQIEAVKRLVEALEGARRRFLLVMATGTGKTRTALALLGLLFSARRVQRVLFLADRRELVRQALGAFKDYLPRESRNRIEGGEADHTARVHVATYPSMMQVYGQLSCGYYDLVIADESHRSIYNRYKKIFDHFDALFLGLTATPTDYIDHNTFALFACPDGEPTFEYGYPEAVQDRYLAQYRVLESKTKFQIEGIKAGQLPPEFRRQLQEQGIELSEVNFEGSDLERRVTNVGTNDAIVREFMENCRRAAGGALPAKTIIFAMSHAHALELYKSFNRLYPDLQRRGLARVIDSHMERADRTLDDFKFRQMPCVAISVDMLDTGIDVPAIQNLVLAKPVFSQVKFWQMIGRGTRLWTDPQSGVEKRDFLILDFWDNFAYFQLNPQGEVANPTEPLPVRLFRLRLEKLALLRGLEAGQDAASAVAQLQTMLAQLPAENVNVRPHLDELAALAQPQAWARLDEARHAHLNKTIAPLLRFAPDFNLPVATFEARTEQLALAHLKGDAQQIERLREHVLAELAALPTDLPEVAAQAETLAWVASPGFWQHLDHARVMDLQARCAPLMCYRHPSAQQIIRLNLPDQIVRRLWIAYGPAGEGAFVGSYRQQVEAHVRDLAEGAPALQKLRQGDPLDEADLQALAQALNRPDLFITEETLRQAYDQPHATLVDFLRHILGVAAFPGREALVREAFDDFLAAHPHFRASQVQFVRVLRAAVLHRARLTTQDLALPPFTRAGQADRLFTSHELDELLALADQFTE